MTAQTLEDRAGKLKPCVGFKVAPNKKHFRLSGHKLIGVEKKRPKSFIPVGEPSIAAEKPEHGETVEFCYKLFALWAVKIPVRGLSKKEFYRDNQATLKHFARLAADKCNVAYSALVDYIRVSAADLAPVFVGVDVEAERVEEKPEPVEMADPAEQFRYRHLDPWVGIAPKDGNGTARTLEQWHEEALAEDKSRRDIEEALEEEIKRTKARSEARKAAKEAKEAYESGQAKKQALRARRQERAEREAREAREAAQARQRAARARVEAEAGISPKPDPKPLEANLEPSGASQVPESKEVKDETRRRQFAQLLGPSPRRRRAEQFLSDLRAK